MKCICDSSVVVVTTKTQVADAEKTLYLCPACGSTEVDLGDRKVTEVTAEEFADNKLWAQNMSQSGAIAS